MVPTERPPPGHTSSVGNSHLMKRPDRRVFCSLAARAASFFG